MKVCGQTGYRTQDLWHDSGALQTALRGPAPFWIGFFKQGSKQEATEVVSFLKISVKKWQYTYILLSQGGLNV